MSSKDTISRLFWKGWRDMSRRANKLNRRNKDRQFAKWQSQPVDYTKSISIAMGLSLLATAKKNRRSRNEI